MTKDKSLFTVKQITKDEFVATVVDFVPDPQELTLTKPLTKGLSARDQCGDGTDEFRHNDPLVVWNTKNLPVKYYIHQIPMGLHKGIDNAFMEINKLYGEKLFEKTVNQAEAKVIISLMQIDVSGRTLARAQWFYSPSTKLISRATITFDSSENWSYLDNESCGSNGNIFDIGNVGMHEIGHIVGLGHAPTDKLQTMYASTGPGQTLGRSFGDGDILGFSEAYNIVVPEPDENKPPTAVSFGVETEQDKPVLFDLQGTDPEGKPLIYKIVKNPSNGTVHDMAFGTLVQVDYRPNTGFTGTDSFDYKAIDNKGLDSNVATVTINVKPTVIDPPINRPPVAQDIQVTIEQNQEIMIQLQATDPDNDPFTFKLTSADHGNVVLAEPDTAFFVPENDYIGTATFRYYAIDDKGLQSNVATVTITINIANKPPQAANLLVETGQDKPIIITLQATDPEGEQITYQIVDMPMNGEIEVLGPERLTYTPNQDYVGMDKFTYIAIDEHDNQSNEANVTIMIRAVEPVPTPNHKLTQHQLTQIKVLTMVYEQFDKAGLKEQAIEARERLQQYILDSLVELHS